MNATETTAEELEVRNLLRERANLYRELRPRLARVAEINVRLSDLVPEVDARRAIDAEAARVVVLG